MSSAGWMEDQHLSLDYAMWLPDICSQRMVGGWGDDNWVGEESKWRAGRLAGQPNEVHHHFGSCNHFLRPDGTTVYVIKDASSRHATAAPAQPELKAT